MKSTTHNEKTPSTEMQLLQREREWDPDRKFTEALTAILYEGKENVEKRRHIRSLITADPIFRQGIYLF